MPKIPPRPGRRPAVQRAARPRPGRGPQKAAMPPRKGGPTKSAASAVAAAVGGLARPATPAPALVPPVAAPQAATNPYTGKPLGANEYVGVAGSEAEHPGMVRVPPPGWWDPSNPNYERRAYYHDSAGNVVAIEPGYYGDAEHPYDTGREGERNTEYGRGGEGIIRMSQPGLPTWGPGQARPKPTVGVGASAPAVGAPGLAGPTGLDSMFANAQLGDPGTQEMTSAQDQLNALLAELGSRVRRGRQRGAYRAM